MVMSDWRRRAVKGNCIQTVHFTGIISHPDRNFIHSTRCVQTTTLNATMRTARPLRITPEQKQQLNKENAAAFFLGYI